RAVFSPAGGELGTCGQQKAHLFSIPAGEAIGGETPEWLAAACGMGLCAAETVSGSHPWAISADGAWLAEATEAGLRLRNRTTCDDVLSLSLAAARDVKQLGFA